MGFKMSDTDKNVPPVEAPKNDADSRHDFPEYERSGVHEIDRDLLEIHDGWQPIRRKLIHERKLAG